MCRGWLRELSRARSAGNERPYLLYLAGPSAVLRTPRTSAVSAQSQGASSKEVIELVPGYAPAWRPFWQYAASSQEWGPLAWPALEDRRFWSKLSGLAQDPAPPTSITGRMGAGPLSVARPAPSRFLRFFSMKRPRPILRGRRRPLAPNDADLSDDSPPTPGFHASDLVRPLGRPCSIIAKALNPIMAGTEYLMDRRDRSAFFFEGGLSRGRSAPRFPRGMRGIPEPAARRPRRLPPAAGPWLGRPKGFSPGGLRDTLESSRPGPRFLDRRLDAPRLPLARPPRARRALRQKPWKARRRLPLRNFHLGRVP